MVLWLIRVRRVVQHLSSALDKKMGEGEQQLPLKSYWKSWNGARRDKKTKCPLFTNSVKKMLDVSLSHRRVSIKER